MHTWVEMLPAGMVNSPHLRKAENAVMVAASKLSWPERLECVMVARMCTSTSHVISSLGMHSRCPMYLLMPLMTLWRRGDSHAENGRPVSMWADHRWVMYDLIVLGWSCLTPPSQATHSSSAVWETGSTELSMVLNCG